MGQQPIHVYYRPTCAFSLGAFSFLALRGADFAATNLDERNKAESELLRRLGDRKLETPTFEIGGQLHVAPKLSELKDLLQEWGLPPEAAPHAQR